MRTLHVERNCDCRHRYTARYYHLADGMELVEVEEHRWSQLMDEHTVHDNVRSPSPIVLAHLTVDCDGACPRSECLGFDFARHMEVQINRQMTVLN